MSRALIALTAALLGALACGPSAQAEYEPFKLIDGSPALKLQAEKAFDASISADGSYVAYTGSIAGQAGIYRTDVEPGPKEGQEEAVALGVDTGAPAISAKGRYISFTTSDDPETGVPVADGCSDVYVRDMEKKPGEAGRYTLVSARDESNEGLAYASPKTVGEACGAASAYRVAISGDGREVAFTVLSASDLTSEVPGHTETPAGQVAVRDLDTKHTTLVSATRASLEGGGKPEPVPGGAALTSSEKILFEKNPGAPTSASTAAISADGTTVAWMGIDVQEQTDLATAPPNEGAADGYAEPLWRNFTEGPRTPTRSVLAGGDASAAECPPSCPGGLDMLWHEGADVQPPLQGPAYGSYLAPSGFRAAGGTNTDPLDVVTPQLSENGMTVALLSTQPTYGNDPKYGPNQAAPPTANAFVVNMTPGLARARAITRLTEWASLNLKDTALAGGISEIAISPDGKRVAFITQRVEFPLAPPALVTPPLSQAATNQLYVVNLAAATLEFVSRGYEGQPANANVLDAALDGDGGTLALASSASNLAFGTSGNNEFSNIFVTHEPVSSPGPGQQSVSSLPALSIPGSGWSLSATVRRATDGSLLIDAYVPGAGSLVASARASVPTAAKTANRTRKRKGSGRTRAKRSSGSSTSRGQSTPARRIAVIAARQVAAAETTSKGAELVQLRLAPTSRYRSLAYGKGGLYATITVIFSAPNNPRLSTTLYTSFQAQPVNKSRSKSARKSRKRLGRRRHP